MTGCQERFLTRSSCGEDPDQGWRAEAQAVIQEIRDYVNSIAICQSLPCDEFGVYFNLETKESIKVTIELGTAGYRVCGKPYDTLDPISSKHFETIYALLDSLSPGYRNSFSSALAHKLSRLCQNQTDGADFIG